MEYREYVESIVANASEMIAAVEMTKDELLKVLPFEDHGNIIHIENEMRTELVRDAFRLGLVPFMQQAVEGEEEEEEREAR